RLRALVKLIEKQQRKPIYTDFEDEIGSETTVDLPGFATPDSFERFRAKARAFLKDHEDHIAIRKLRLNSPSRRGISRSWRECSSPAGLAVQTTWKRQKRNAPVSVSSSAR